MTKIEKIDPVLSDNSTNSESPFRPQKRKRTTVYNIVKNKLFLKDEDGFEYRLNITDKNKFTKIGDIVYL